MTGNKKTAGIATFNRALNYGAVLQSYALKRVCENLGYETHVIDYKVGNMGKQPAPVKSFLSAKNRKKALVRTAKGMLGVHWSDRKWNAFASFREKYLSETKECSSGEDISLLGFDAYILGSDQIWNYNITGGKFDPVFFGEIPSKAVKVIYAASSQDIPFPRDKENGLIEYLGDTDAAVSTREESLSDYVYSLTGVSYPFAADPTVLAGREIMEEITPESEEKEPYILIYQIDRNPASDISVRSLEKKFGMKVYTMTLPRIGSLHGRRGDCGPEGFLALLKNAEFLVTNSFHGVAISLLFEKQFYVYENGGVMSRIDNLLKQVGLTDRKVRFVKEIDISRKIDYVPVNEKLSAMRSQSMIYLTEALEGRQIYREKPESAEWTLPALRDREKKECSGCGACAEACPVLAIHMEQDREGFLYPVIDEDKCVHCGLCDRVCGFQPADQIRGGRYDLPKAYGVKHKDLNKRMTSRSGAAFVAFSDRILKQGGAVYGAAMMSDFSVRHIRAVTPEERDRMKNAKYVQSIVTMVLPDIMKDLKDGIPVLFSGTPCQVAGVYALLNAKGIRTDKLITCDLVCHGVPSPAIWKDYVEWIERKFGKKIVKASFRDKEYGWDTHFESFELEDGKKKLRREYTDLFYEHIMFRPSCHACHFANTHRVADLTLADFWGIEKHDRSFDDNRGVSLVLANTEKGSEMLESVKDELEWFSCDILQCLQPTLVKPSRPSVQREDFWRDYCGKGFDWVIRKYTVPQDRVKRIKRSIKQTMYTLRIRNHP